jgi:hypothetical protein
MRRSLAILVLLMCPPARARADEPVFVDSLVPQRIPVTSFRHMGRQGFDAERSDSLTGLALRIVEELDALESACRTHLYSKESEPGSPWLMWRSFRRVQAGNTPWYVGGLSCTDLLCRYSLTEDESPVELVLHDRVALVGIGPERTCVYLFPPEPATIHDEGTAAIDSVGAIQGGDHVLVQIRRAVNSEHPCYDGGDREWSDEHYFVVLRGDSLLQCFRMILGHGYYSHDDVDGDAETYRTVALAVTANSIRMSYQDVETQHSLDENPAKDRTRVTRRGVVELAWDARTGRFRRKR